MAVHQTTAETEISDFAQTPLQILLNGEKHDQQQDEVPCGDPKEEHTSSAGLDNECTADKDAQVKMQSILQQVCKQIRSQGAVRTPKSSILELVQKICEKEAENTEISDFSPKPLKILLNREKQDQQQDEVPCDDLKEEDTSSASLDDECTADKDTQVKMQSILQQVRRQIKSQGSVRAPKRSILELVQRICEKEVVNSEVDNGNSDVEKQAEMLTDATHQKEEDLCAIFQEKLEALEKTLREEFQAQILQLHKEMQAYTEHALRDLECKIKNIHDVVTSPKDQPKQGLDKTLPSSAALPMVLRRGRVLTRTMTTIVPKTCTPVIIGPRAKSETLSSSKTRILKDPMLTAATANDKPYQSRRPLPPAGPRQPKKSVPPKAKMGKMSHQYWL